MPIIVEDAVQTVPEFSLLVAWEHALIYTPIRIIVAPVLGFRVVESLQHVVLEHVPISAPTPVIAAHALPLAHQPPQVAALGTARILLQILIIAPPASPTVALAELHHAPVYFPLAAQALVPTYHRALNTVDLVVLLHVPAPSQAVARTLLAVVAYVPILARILLIAELALLLHALAVHLLVVMECVLTWPLALPIVEGAIYRVLSARVVAPVSTRYVLLALSPDPSVPHQEHAVPSPQVPVRVENTQLVVPIRMFVHLLLIRLVEIHVVQHSVA
ncbi:hypothetical protein N7486_010145 [Penicillium sp. IBT 16267x]|nr:hypothetical protein N7486_010145 [Penicillium sp. IBT 16267x]